jgi:hypothetical protein
MGSEEKKNGLGYKCGDFANKNEDLSKDDVDLESRLRFLAMGNEQHAV